MGCETKFFADRFLRDRSICDPIYSFGATFALSPRVRGERRREGFRFRHLKNFVSHPVKMLDSPNIFLTFTVTFAIFARR
jgi:hypothetical protein